MCVCVCVCVCVCDSDCQVVVLALTVWDNPHIGPSSGSWAKRIQCLEEKYKERPRAAMPFLLLGGQLK